MADEILSDLHLPTSALLYAGGGHFYLLLPNTEIVQTKLRRYKEHLNDWFSDPIRNFSDGPCLHIARHYQPTRVVLYFTGEILRAKGEDFYKKPLLHLNPHLQIECIYSGVTNPHLYDSFLQAAPGIIPLPQALHDVHDRYPEAEILINVTSGTPQIQGTLVTLALQEPTWCRAIQVTTPEKKGKFSARGTS